MLLAGVWKTPALVGTAAGEPGSLRRALAPMPVLSPQVVGWARWLNTGETSGWTGAGGLGLRVRPLANLESLALRGLWLDASGTYGTAGLGAQGNVGWNFHISRGVAIGPQSGVRWDGDGATYIFAVGMQFSGFGDGVGRSVTITP